MNKSIKKVLVTGASLLMMASVGAGASQVVIPVHASRSFVNVAYGTGFGKYVPWHHRHYIGHGVGARQTDDRPSWFRKNGHIFHMDTMADITSIDGIYKPTRAQVRRALIGNSRNNSASMKRYRARIRRRIHHDNAVIHQYNVIERRKRNAKKDIKKRIHNIHVIAAHWQKPAYNPASYKGHDYQVAFKGHNVGNIPYSFADMKNLLNQYSRNAGLKALNGMWDINSGNNSFVGSGLSIKPISKREAQSTYSFKTVKGLKRSIRVIDQLRSGKITRINNRNYTVDWRPMHSQLRLYKVSHNKLRIDFYFNHKKIARDYATKENPKTKSDKQSLNDMWKYRPYGFYIDGL